jgi:two-component system, response regulator
MSQGTILLVEDSKNDIALTVRAIRKNNIRNDLVVVTDGAEALDYLFGGGSYRDRDVRRVPWIILLDLKLPRIDGLETLARLRASEQTSLVPVIILSSSNEERDVIASYKLGANGFIRKPTNFIEFTKAIEILYGFWRINEIAPAGRPS